MSLDARQKPREDLRALYKRYQKISMADLDQDVTVLDFERGLSAQQRAMFEIRPFNHEVGDRPASDGLDGVLGLPSTSYSCRTLPGLWPALKTPVRSVSHVFRFDCDSFITVH